MRVFLLIALMLLFVALGALEVATRTMTIALLP